MHTNISKKHSFSKPNTSKSIVHFIAQVSSVTPYCHLESNTHVHDDRIKFLEISANLPQQLLVLPS